ncbi:MAG: phage tail protein [Rhizobiales bacterium 65-9]|nr:phage tail tape measure protein [Hyphomicrobiales bacterium]OJY38178.1 MAG: phage tail protein [Rhizobiales bacterium 65-9]
MAEEDDIAGTLSSSLDTARELKATTDALGKSISSAFARGVVDGRRFEDVLRSIGQRMISFGLRAAFKPVDSALQSALGSLFSGSWLGGAGAPLNILPSASGNAFQFGKITPFAAGGVVAAPTYFPMSGGFGLMGERGAEAVMPLQRGPDGRLGVRAAQSAAPAVTVNIATPDIDGFRRSESQVAAALARAVARGRRSV